MNLDRAREFYIASLEIRREIADRKGEGWMSHHLASVFLLQGDKENALARLNDAVGIAKEMEDRQLTEACANLRTQSEEKECHAT